MTNTTELIETGEWHVSRRGEIAARSCDTFAPAGPNASRPRKGMIAWPDDHIRKSPRAKWCGRRGVVPFLACVVTLSRAQTVPPASAPEETITLSALEVRESAALAENNESGATSDDSAHHAIDFPQVQCLGQLVAG
ncbi:MAG: hypothetical protein HYV96_14525 [Opitutae bacterium]|nr:hypothetical protein [Opitutae bacterium]